MNTSGQTKQDRNASNVSPINSNPAQKVNVPNLPTKTEYSHDQENTNKSNTEK